MTNETQVVKVLTQDANDFFFSDRFREGARESAHFEKVNCLPRLAPQCHVHA